MEKSDRKGKELTPADFGFFDDITEEQSMEAILSLENTHHPVPEEREGYLGLDKLLSDLISQPKETYIEQTRTQLRKQKQPASPDAKYEERYFNRFVYAIKSPNKSKPASLTRGQHLDLPDYDERREEAVRSRLRLLLLADSPALLKDRQSGLPRGANIQAAEDQERLPVVHPHDSRPQVELRGAQLLQSRRVQILLRNRARRTRGERQHHGPCPDGLLLRELLPLRQLP